MAAMLIDPEHAVRRPTPVVGAGSPSFETVLLEPAVSTRMKTAPSIMEVVMAMDKLNKANEEYLVPSWKFVTAVLITDRSSRRNPSLSHLQTQESRSSEHRPTLLS